jgi:signal transduction histidine kinase/CheY-like chemotaxis protein
MVVDRELARRAAIARTLADSRALDAGADLLPADKAYFEQQARRAMAALSGWVEVSSADGVLLSTRSRSRPQAPSAAAAPPLADMPTVRALHDEGDGAGLRAALVQPVRRGDKTLLNVAVTILPSELQGIIDAQSLPPDAVATILDNRGTVVARHPRDPRFVGRSATPDIMALSTQYDDAPFESVSLDGMPTVGYFATSPQDWVYLTAVPRQRFASTIPAAVAPMALGALLLLALAVGGTLWVSRSIATPVVSLKRLAARMQSGSSVEVRRSGIAEIDEVAAAMAAAAASLRDGRAELERQVADAVARTRSAEQRISQSQRAEALGRLTGGVAHDFNNVLGIISNCAHLMQRLDSAKQLQAPLAATLRAVDVGSRMTQHLMRFAGRRRVRTQPLDLAPYLSEAQELIRIVLGKRIQLSLWCEPALPPVSVDSGELELALLNLALNARDAMPDGGQVGLHARIADARDTGALPPGRYVMVAMTDSGVGVDAASIEHVFEPFFTTKAAGKGTGLGLSQVYGFCQQTGGTALISSVPQVGTTVSMLLPATTLAPDGAPPLAPAAELHAIAGRRVLLVEDNAELGETTARLLESYGCQVLRAPSAAHALQLLHDGANVDVVLSDVLMPGDMDGLTMARRLREMQPALPIVLISGYSTALTQAKDFVVLSKPCAPDELLGTLKRAIDSAAAAP